jgi:hypothetical protein
VQQLIEAQSCSSSQDAIFFRPLRQVLMSQVRSWCCTDTAGLQRLRPAPHTDPAEQPVFLWVMPVRHIGSCLPVPGMPWFNLYCVSSSWCFICESILLVDHPRCVAFIGYFLFDYFQIFLALLSDLDVVTSFLAVGFSFKLIWKWYTSNLTLGFLNF